MKKFYDCIQYTFDNNVYFLEFGCYINAMKNNIRLDECIKKSLSESISDSLRDAIMTGGLTEGTQIKQDHMAQQFNVSISVIREALKILEGEGLVEFLPNHGAAVAKLSSEEALDIFAIRVLLETEALALSIPQLTAEDYQQLEAVLAEEETCTEPQRYNELNSLFHEYLYKYCANKRLNDLIRLQHNNVGRYLVFYLDKMAFKDQSHKEHLQLLEACKTKDITKAKKLLKQHMQKAGKQLAAFLQK